MEAYFIALGGYIMLSLLATRMIREDERAEMFRRYGLTTKYQRIKDFVKKLF